MKNKNKKLEKKKKIASYEYYLNNLKYTVKHTQGSM
jgi:hypothetical protein